jgi:hypothetical protein
MTKPRISSPTGVPANFEYAAGIWNVVPCPVPWCFDRA